MRIESEKTLRKIRSFTVCELCGGVRIALEPHHVFARGRGDAFRNDLRINLLALCRTCHAAAESGSVTRQRCLEVIAERDGIEIGMLRQILQRLRHA